MAMDKKVKSKWLAALRTAKQVTGRMCRRYPSGKIKGYCCLGVLAREQGAKFDKYGNIIFEGEMLGWHGGFDNAKLAAGLTLKEMEALVRMNDGGSSFKEISKWIRKNL